MLLARSHHLVAAASQVLPRSSTRPSPSMPHAPLPDSGSRPNNDADSAIPNECMRYLGLVTDYDEWISRSATMLTLAS